MAKKQQTKWYRTAIKMVKNSKKFFRILKRTYFRMFFVLCYSKITKILSADFFETAKIELCYNKYIKARVL